MLNIKQIGGFVGSAGFSVRELSTIELLNNCNGSNPGTFYDLTSNSKNLPPNNGNGNFTDFFFVRYFTSGCYYFDYSAGKWVSNGLKIMPDSTAAVTHCIVDHLTDFAGGLVVLPTQIDFTFDWANANFYLNPTIYITVISMTMCLIFSAIIAFWFDMRDKKKYNITPLTDNLSDDSYFYEVIVFTGNRKGAQTDSNVKFIIRS